MLEATITDALFDMNYLALNVGGSITVGGDSLVTESVKTAEENTITVTGTPVAFGNAGVVGWYTIQGQDNWTPITFNGKTATATGLAANTDVCVQYNATNNAMQQFVIPSSVIPAEVHIVMRYPLFAAGSDITSLASSSQVGELVVDIPRFQFAGNIELSLNSSGAATSNLSGSALASYTTANCEDMGRYGTIKMNIFGKNWYDDLEAMAVDGAEFTLATSGTKTLKVIGVFRNGGTIMTGVLNNANLTFVSASESVATVSDAGVVSAAGVGTTTIEIKATDKSTVACYAEVTVSNS